MIRPLLSSGAIRRGHPNDVDTLLDDILRKSLDMLPFHMFITTVSRRFRDLECAVVQKQRHQQRNLTNSYCQENNTYSYSLYSEAALDTYL